MEKQTVALATVFAEPRIRASKVHCIFLSPPEIFPSGTEILSMLFPIVSASLGHMMGEVSAVSPGS